MKNKIILITFLLALCQAQAGDLKIPAFTAYLQPTDGGAWVSESDGVTGWDNPAQKVLWFGEITEFWRTAMFGRAAVARRRRKPNSVLRLPESPVIVHGQKARDG